MLRNESVMFSGNYTDSYGGAIYADSGLINFAGNEAVVFSKNTSYNSAGAIYAGAGTVSFIENGVVAFIGNYAWRSTYSSGGAIYRGSVNMTNNGSVEFSGNFASYQGGAIYGGTLDLTGNGSVTFSGNSASSTGGAIFTSGTLNLTGNESVIFRGNYEKTESTFRLRSVYMTRGTLQLAAGEGQNITFYDTLYAAEGTLASFNSAYQDGDGVQRDATGDIVLSGKYAVEDLKELKANYTQQELADSLTTEVYATTNLYGGRLRIEDGAIYKGNGISAAVESGATLRLQNGTLDQVGYDVTLASGTTLDLQNVNTIVATMLDMQDHSTLSFTLGETNLSQAALTLDGTFNQGGDLIINIQGDETYNPEDRYRLISMTSGLNPESWETTMITLIGVDSKVNHLEWENGVLYFKAVPPLVAATWSGEQSMVWNTTVKNWVQDDIAYAYKDGVDVEFSNTGSGSVILEGNLAPASVLVDNGTNHDYTFTGDGKLTGGMQLTKEGNGTLTIGTANDYTGGTVINGGVVVVGNATALGSGDVALNGGELDIATDATISGQITVEGDNFLIVDDGCTLSLGNRIANNYYLEMWGTYDISNLSAEVLESGYIGGAVKGNGFVGQELQVQVVDNGFGAYTEMGYASFLYNGFEGEVGYEGEVIVTTLDDSVFYVNSGTEGVLRAYSDHTPDTIVLKRATGLNLDVDDIELPNIELAANEDSAYLNVMQDTTIDSITGGDGSFILNIYGMDDKTLTLMDASGYVGAMVFAGGTVTAGSATAFGASKIWLSDATLDLGGFEVANAMNLWGDTTIGNGALAGSLSAYNTTIHVSSDATVNGTLTTDGTSGIEVSQDEVLTLGRVVQNTGVLALSGTFDISALSSIEREAEYIGGTTEGNGFLSQSRDIEVVNNTQGGTSDLANGTFIYNGETADSVSGGTASLTSVDYSRFFVFSGEESLGAALDTASAAGAEVGGITMSAGTTLHVDRDMSADFVSVASGSVQLDVKGSSTVTEGATPHSEFILTGSGVYALASGNTALAPTLDSEGWTGTVALKDIVMNNPDFLDLDNYGHEGSAVRLDGVKANFGANGNTFSTALELTGDGLEITTCQNNRSYEFAGGVKGDGNLVYNLSSAAHNQTYIFSGDVSDWTGAYVSAANKTSTLQFQDDATVMGADIIREQGVVNVVVGDGSEEHTTVFKGDVQASNLTVQENAKAVIEGNAVIEKTATHTGILSLQGTLEVADGGSLALSQDASVQVGDAFTVAGKGDTSPALSGNLEITEGGFYGIGDKAARIDHSVIKLEEGASVVFDNVILGASSQLKDDPATVVVNNLVIEGILGENVQEGEPLTIKSGSVLRLTGPSGQTVVIEEDSFACTFDITNVQDVQLSGNCLTIDLSSMYPKFKDMGESFDWLGIALGSGDHAPTIDENLEVVVQTLPNQRARGYVGWGGTFVTVPEHGENVGPVIYFHMYEVPEPTTGSLSLLALAALAARRRRSR